MKSNRGFTLLEVLVALTLTGLLVVALFGGFRAGIRSWQTVERHTALVEEPRQLSAMLYRHLGQMIPAVFGTNSEGGQEAGFIGEVNRIRYVAPLAMSANGLPYIFEMVSNREGQEGVWVRFAPYQADKPSEEQLAGSDFLQVSKTLDVTFRYFGVGNDSNGIERWSDTYSSNELPRLVSFRLAGSERAWPEMIFPVTRIGVPSE
ncbi:prepilin-type N-terminal cleavage/methylation domain-containing protein [Pseudomonas sp. RIT-PI-AD]|uniref:prepilin-type N-terminal cleavage/methylation domain-containing protein n=1 Tax=Pseudomonas sp. RIT-PI-AD TaxID=3035294 RepID=UPI0021D83A9F|nr:prepilin-type N-terminal cleavage/methylation domain-containing protein [Pseudomonas sp. RIT-PI-AD]